MIKKLDALVIFIILIACMTGCGGSSSGSNEKAVTNTEILTLLDNYEKAVEAYNVNGMLACLDSGSFVLTINEGSYTTTKDYNTLKTELENDEANQLAWRKSPAEDPINGHSYILNLAFIGNPMSGNETSTGAVVRQTFEVWESSVENPATKTDSGTIVWTLVQSSGEWKATAMTINYNSGTASSSLKAARKVTGSAEKGFGFGSI